MSLSHPPLSASLPPSLLSFFLLLLSNLIFSSLLSAASLQPCSWINSYGGRKSRVVSLEGFLFKLPVKWPLGEGLQRATLCMCVCLWQCVDVCVHSWVMACYRAFSTISHMPSLPKACGIVKEKNWIKVILSLCSSSPQPLCSSLYTLPTSSSFRVASSTGSSYVQCLITGSRGSQDAMDTAKNVCTGAVILSFSFENQQMRQFLSLLTQLHLLQQFYTNKCVHCETRQISSDWSTCITMSLSSKINALMHKIKEHFLTRVF